MTAVVVCVTCVRTTSKKDTKAILTPFESETGVVILFPFGEEWITAVVEKTYVVLTSEDTCDTHSVREQMERCIANLIG